MQRSLSERILLPNLGLPILLSLTMGSSSIAKLLEGIVVSLALGIGIQP